MVFRERERDGGSETIFLRLRHWLVSEQGPNAGRRTSILFFLYLVSPGATSAMME